MVTIAGTASEVVITSRRCDKYPIGVRVRLKHPTDRLVLNSHVFVASVFDVKLFENHGVHFLLRRCTTCRTQQAVRSVIITSAPYWRETSPGTSMKVLDVPSRVLLYSAALACSCHLPHSFPNRPHICRLLLGQVMVVHQALKCTRLGGI
jgi:hypothetical protein